MEGGGKLIINKGTDKERDVGMYATGIKLKKGDHIWFSQSGGGGVGDPRERDPELVLRDVMDGWLSIEAGRKYYGVVINEIDEEALDYRIDMEGDGKAAQGDAKEPASRGETRARGSSGRKEYQARVVAHIRRSAAPHHRFPATGMVMSYFLPFMMRKGRGD